MQVVTGFSNETKQKYRLIIVNLKLIIHVSPEWLSFYLQDIILMDLDTSFANLSHAWFLTFSSEFQPLCYCLPFLEVHRLKILNFLCYAK